MPRKPTMSLAGLADAWDGIASVRKNIRECHELLLCFEEPTFKATAHNCSVNGDVIIPVLEATKETLSSFLEYF